MQNNILKKQSNCGIELPNDKLLTSIEISNELYDSNFQTENAISNKLNEYSSQSTINDENKLFQLGTLESNNQNSNQSEDVKIINLSLNSANKEDTNTFKQVSIVPEPEKFTNETNSDVGNIVQESNMETVIDKIQSDINDGVNNKKSKCMLIKPSPKKIEPLLKLLSDDLLTKTLEVFIYKYYNYNKKNNP